MLAAGGVAPDQSHWISSRHSFFLPIKGLSRVFRGKFVDGLKTAVREAKIEFKCKLAPLADPRTFAFWLRLLFRQNWVVYSKQPFGDPEHSRYLGSSTHSVAISNHRLVALDDGNVTPSVGEISLDTLAVSQTVLPAQNPPSTSEFLLGPVATIGKKPGKSR